MFILGKKENDEDEGPEWCQQFTNHHDERKGIDTGTSHPSGADCTVRNWSIVRHVCMPVFSLKGNCLLLANYLYFCFFHTSICANCYALLGRGWPIENCDELSVGPHAIWYRVMIAIDRRIICLPVNRSNCRNVVMPKRWICSAYENDSTNCL